MNLPIHGIRPELVAALAGGRRFLLQAPTGSGKSTQVPQLLLDACAVQGQVVVLQPRRIAARMLARRVAGERGSPVGQEVGYQVRFENVVSAQTRIRYVTEGMLLRQMLDTPDLPGVGAVIFDEFHERHLHGDVGLAQAAQLQREVRPELVVGVMSATLEPAPLLEFLAPCAHLRSEGRTFPVEVNYAGSGAGGRPGGRGRGGRGGERGGPPVWERAAEQFRRVAGGEETGDVLIFMPGSYEIARTVREIESSPAARGWAVLPLHGDLSPEAQDAALGRPGCPKVVVSTNVAETSLTIDGVRTVIDSGLARVPSFDPARGINTLLVQNISRAAADQRAGRAGRTAPGTCIRLWGEREHAHRPAREDPEVRRLDLSETVLTLLTSGIEDAATFPWFEAPGADNLGRATRLLDDLGARNPATGAITETGRRMASFPLHPRYARLFLEADQRGCLRPIALIAALAQGRPILLPLDDRRRAEEREEMLAGGDGEAAGGSDFFPQLQAWSFARQNRFDATACRDWGIHAQAARQAAQMAEQFFRIARSVGLEPGGGEGRPEDIRRCLLAGFSDNLARRLDRGTLRCALVHGRRGDLRRNSVVRDAPLLVAAEVEERDHRGDVTVLLGHNTAVEEAWLQEQFPGDFSEGRTLAYDPKQKRVVALRERRFRDLVLEAREEEPGRDEAAALLAAEFQAGRLKLKRWDDKVEAWVSRVNFLAQHCPDYGFAPIADGDRLLLLEQICLGAASFKEARDRDPWPALHAWLTAEQRACMDDLAPLKLPLPGGGRANLRYPGEGRAVLSATIQQFYGAPERVAIAAGRCPVLFELLAPNRRPVQTTADLGAFWETGYPEVKKQLKGRYPKHKWR